MIQCLTPDGLAYFIEVTGLKIPVSNTEYVLLKGFSFMNGLNHCNCIVLLMGLSYD